MTAFTVFCLLLIACQVLDAVSTYRAIKAGANEDNRVLVWIASQFARFTGARWAWLFWSKSMAVALLAWFAVFASPPDWAAAIFGMLFIVYAAVIIRNFSLFRL